MRRALAPHGAKILNDIPVMAVRTGLQLLRKLSEIVQFAHGFVQFLLIFKQKAF